VRLQGWMARARRGVRIAPFRAAPAEATADVGAVAAESKHPVRLKLPSLPRMPLGLPRRHSYFRPELPRGVRQAAPPHRRILHRAPSSPVLQRRQRASPPCPASRARVWLHPLVLVVSSCTRTGLPRRLMQFRWRLLLLLLRLFVQLQSEGEHTGHSLGRGRRLYSEGCPKGRTATNTS
jgi:hypothetical protein